MSGDAVLAFEQNGPTPNRWLSALKPYVAGESDLAGVERPVKLSSNENPVGPSPRAMDAYRRAADQLGIYPDGAAVSLRGAIASVHGIDPARVVCGAGSDELIGLIIQAFCGAGDEVIHTAHAFAMYKIYAQAFGAVPVSVPETADLTADPGAILDAITPKTKVIFLANPNNPTGTYLPRAALERLIDAVPARVLFVIDGAYAEYMRASDYTNGLDLVDSRPNVAVTRSFSKIHGLAALRLGWMYGPDVVADALNRARGPFNVGAPTLAAGEAAVRDTSYTEACAIQNEVWRDWLTKELRSAGVDTPDSYGNFVLPRFGASGPTSAAAADAFLKSRGIIVRRMDSYGLADRLRITVGASSDNVAVGKAVAEFMAGAGPQ